MMQKFFRDWWMLCLTAIGGCVPMDRWKLNSFSDEKTYVQPDAAAAVADEHRLMSFMQTIGFKLDRTPSDDQPATEAVFIRDDNDHFHVSVTIRTLARLDHPGFVTKVHVDSAAIGQEGAIETGKTVQNEIDQFYRFDGPSFHTIGPALSIGEPWDQAKAAATAAGYEQYDASMLEMMPAPDGFYLELPDRQGLLVFRDAKTDQVRSIDWIENWGHPKVDHIYHTVSSFDLGDKDPASSHDLMSQVGQAVALEGQFGGPGKQADFVMVNGIEIYLTGKIDSGGRPLPYGTVIKVHGRLQNWKSTPTTEPAGAVPYQIPGNYLFIENATVHVVGRPEVKS